MTSKPESRNYAKEDSKVDSKEPSEPNTPRFLGLVGEKYSARDLTMMPRDKASLILIYNIARKVLDT
jgi:hypothetical protein